MSRAIGFVGLGRMGLPMAVSLINAGYTVTGFDPRTMDRFVAAGGKPARSPREAASGQEFVMSCLPGSADILRDVLEGPGGLWPALDAGAVLIETSTHPVDAKRWAAERLAERGAVLLECEITGVPTMVAARQCVFFISGGNRAAFERCLPVFDAITTTQKRYLGPLGTATKMKLVNNLLTCVHVAVAAETLALGIKAGLDPDAMLALFGAGAGSSVMFTQRGPLMAARKFDEFGRTVQFAGETAAGDSGPCRRRRRRHADARRRRKIVCSRTCAGARFAGRRRHDRGHRVA